MWQLLPKHFNSPCSWLKVEELLKTNNTSERRQTKLWRFVVSRLSPFDACHKIWRLASKVCRWRLPCVVCHWRSTLDVSRLAFNIGRLPFGVRRLAFDVWHLAFDVLHLAFDVWRFHFYQPKKLLGWRIKRHLSEKHLLSWIEICEIRK